MKRVRLFSHLPWFHVSPRTSARPGFRPAVETLEDRTTPTVISWTGSAGDSQWSSAGNWDLHRTPGSGDDVVIDVSGKPTIVYSGGSATVNSIASKESLRITGGSLSAANG